MTNPIIISFEHKFAEENANHEELINQYRDWLEKHGRYGRLFMWYIPRPKPGQQAAIAGVKIYEPEIATLFCIMHGFSN